MLIIGLVALSVLVCGCTHIYRPTEYVIGEDRIAGFPIGAPVCIIGEPSPVDDQVVFHVPGSTIVTNYNDVTTALVAQLTKEMAKRGQPVSDSASKTIRLTVLKLGAEVTTITSMGSMLLSLQLGAAQHLSFLIYNTSPRFSLSLSLHTDTDRALNGTIARAVMKILSDPKVRAFLGDLPKSNPG